MNTRNRAVTEYPYGRHVYTTFETVRWAVFFDKVGWRYTPHSAKSPKYSRGEDLLTPSPEFTLHLNSDIDVFVVSKLLALLSGPDWRQRFNQSDAQPERLIVGPERARRQFTSIIAQASSSVRMIDRKASDPALMALLQTRSSEGVRVELYDGKRLCGLRSHGKIMLVDDRLAVIGGLSLNPMSLDFRREVAVTVTEPSAVAEVAGLFAIVAASEAAKVPPPITRGGAAC
jgi:phosphatidylserine/phosphatidylglycerophosphate/cardiolipin synthase-like enzyme